MGETSGSFVLLALILYSNSTTIDFSEFPFSHSLWIGKSHSILHKDSRGKIEYT